MISRKTILVLVLALTASAGAQLVGSSAERPEPAAARPAVTGLITVPVTGTVTGTDVYIRAEGSLDAYTCGKISGGTVEVVEQRGEWLKIVPPSSVFSVISKSYVDRVGDLGTVTGDVVRVRAGSSPMLADADAHHVVQGFLSTGHPVEIIGEGGDFYKIVPPVGAYVWISARYVRLPGQESPEPPSSDDVAVDTEEPDAADAEDAPEMTDLNRQFLAADDMLTAESQKPKLEQNLQAVLGAYQAIEVPSGSPMRGAIDRRIAYVQASIRLQQDAIAVEETAARTRRRQAELQRMIGQGGTGLPATGPAATYDALGVLSASGLYSGGATGQRFLLSDQHTGDTTAYVRDASGQLDLSRYDGRLVGLRGRVTYEAQTGMNIVDVASVTMLAAPAPPPVAPVEPVTPAPVETPPAPLAPAQPAELVAPDVPPVREPVALEPDRPLDALPTTPTEPDVPAAPEVDVTPPAAPEEPAAPEPESPDVPGAPERPSRLVRPEPSPEPAPEDGPGIPTPPERPSRPSTDRPPTPSGETPRPAPEPPAEDVPAPAPPGEGDEEEQPAPPAEPVVPMRRPLPPPGLPIEDESDDGPGIDVREYD